MSSNNVINVTNTDFDGIKASLKSYLQGQVEFQDYDFEGSTMSILLDLMAYNTHYNAVYLNMVGNEMFLDSAQLRDSVVSRAKALDYTPRSARSSFTTAAVVVTPTGSPDSVTVAKNEAFTATLDGTQYKFVTPVAYTFTSGELFSGSITLMEGEPLTSRWTVATSNPENYILNNPGIDTTSISVEVQTSVANTSTTTYTQADNILEVSANSNVFFIQEVDDEYYEIYFGDDVIGNNPVNGNIVIANYRATNGTDSNGIAASSFVNPSTLAGYSTFTAVISAATSGGANNESIESIKFNAPKNYEIQNRAVVAEDYRRIILRDNGDIQSVRVWGGEENTPPVYGKIYISAKPFGETAISTAKKDSIKANLKKYNVMSIDPEFIDPTYIYIQPTIVVNYDSSLTTLSAIEVRDKVVSKITAFETTYLSTFNNTRFRYSQFVKQIDSADPSILGNNTALKLQKRFAPNLTATTKYTIDFGSTVHHGSLASTSFTLSNQTCLLDDDEAGNVRLYYIGASNSKVYLNNTLGTIDYTTGVVVLNSFNPTTADSDGEITVTIEPDAQDITAERFQLLLLADTTVAMQDENTSEVTSAVTVTTTGSVTQISETAVGTLV